MNPNGSCHTQRYGNVPAEPQFSSKEEKARHELAQGVRREDTLKRLHTEKDREVKQAQVEANRLEVSRQETGRALRDVRLRNEQLREFLTLAEGI